jgi:type I restriction enzyme S subunit
VSSSGITGHHNEAKAQPPGVVTGRYGTIGEVFYVTVPYWPLNTALYAIDFHGNNPRFVSYFLRNQLRNYQSDKAAVPGVDRNVLHKLPARCPDPQIQQRIVSTLSAYDDLIENNRRRISLLENAARLLYREWFVYFRFPGSEHVKITNDVPEGWEQGTIDDLFKTSSGGTPSRKKPEYYGGDINWLKTQEMNDGYVFSSNEKITEEGLKGSSAKLFPKNTVVVAMYGATIGRLCILASPSTTNQACCALLPKHDEKDYLFGFSMMDYYAKALKDRGQGAAQNNVSQQVIKSFEILIPSRDLISSYNQSIEPIFEQRKILQAQVAQLVKARDLLLPRLVDGRLEI